MARILSFVSVVLCYTSSLAKAWSLIDTYDVNSWSQSMWLEQRTTNSEYVNYLTNNDAINSGLIRNQNNQLYLGVDTNTVLDPSSGIGRNSVRLRTNKQYNTGTLVVGDFAHIPANICGIWPSFWMVGPAWPQDGEIDIIEGVNQMGQNQITIHTKPGCAPGVGVQGETGQRTGNSDCGQNGGDVGCGIFNTNNQGWGSAFNAAGGGVYAMMWVTGAIQVWSWTAGNVPGDIYSNNPNPAGWGTPVANWASGCDFGANFDNMNIIVNTAFCGNWAGAVWKSGSCASLATECYQYVAANPQAYTEAYWLINSIKVFAQ